MFKYHIRTRTRNLMVVQGSGPALLGRNWLQTFCFRLVKMVIREKDALQQLLCAFFNLFNDELETISLDRSAVIIK